MLSLSLLRVIDAFCSLLAAVATFPPPPAAPCLPPVRSASCKRAYALQWIVEEYSSLQSTGV